MAIIDNIQVCLPITYQLDLSITHTLFCIISILINAPCIFNMTGYLYANKCPDVDTCSVRFCLFSCYRWLSKFAFTRKQRQSVHILAGCIVCVISVHKSWRWCYHRRLKAESQMDNVCVTAHLYCCKPGCRPECFPQVIYHYDYAQRYGINNQQHIVYMYFINEFKYASINDWYEQSYTSGPGCHTIQTSVSSPPSPALNVTQTNARTQ